MAIVRNLIDCSLVSDWPDYTWGTYLGMMIRNSCEVTVEVVAPGPRMVEGSDSCAG